ncbi:MAG TPA: immunoglobulin domain-containing protein [Verrucomicrobiae bacterium]|jgi:hypothetical protein|nr:immunoglobulin domain-containing protein [Verrucomicrobiae bacterium]
MKNNKSKLGLSILAGGLSFVGSAGAVDLITNGSFEDPVAGWQYFSTYNMASQAYYDGPAIPASENPGNNYSWRQSLAFSDWDHYTTPTNLTDFLTYDLRYSASQTVFLTNALNTAAIDAGFGQFTFSSWLSGYGGGPGPEQPFVALRFFDANGGLLNDDVFFDRTSNTHAVTFASGVTSIPADVSQNFEWIKYVDSATVPAGARTATVYLTRSPNAGKTGSPDTYMDLIKLVVVNINDNTFVESVSPVNNSTNAAPGSVVTVNLRDVNTQVDTNTIQFSFDGSLVTPSIQKSGTLTTLQYDPPGLLPPNSSHTYQVIWTDNGSPATTKTNSYAFTVLPYVNVNTGAPLYAENFDEVAEGSLPAGWSVSNATDSDVPGQDINNFHSDTYLDWVVISRSTLANLFNVNPGGADYTTATNVAPNQYVNGQLVTNLISGNFAFAASTDRFGNQVQHLTTSDYDLSGQANVYLSFHSIYAQNQNSLGAVEYSVDGGSSWLPAMYFIDTPEIALDSRGNIDASNTFAAVYPGVPPPGNYGAFISLAQDQWASAASFLNARTDDDTVGSARVEFVRLAGADNKATVRFRFTQAGADSYYFGIDDFALYGIATVDAPSITTEPASQTVAVGNAATLTVAATGVGPLTYQWRRNGAPLAGYNGPALITSSATTNLAGSYDVVISNAGGSVTSSPAAIVTVVNPIATITGQWDFNGDLSADYGQNLQYFDATVAADSSFGTTSGLGIGNINGQAATVMHFNPSVPAWGGYRMFHGIAPNGGGFKVNQYTLIYDVYYPGSSDGAYRPFIQLSTNNADDADLFINPGDGIGISSIYNGDVTPDTWHRIAFGVDLSGPGPHPVLTKFIDGVKVGEQTAGLSSVDGRFSMISSALLFADNDGDNAEAYVSSVQVASGRLSDAYLIGLGGPNAKKIPGLIKVTSPGGAVTISWTGGVPLQSSGSVTGPWTVVAGATSPYAAPSVTTNIFYRPQLP